MLFIKPIELNNRNNSLNLLRLIFASFVLIEHSFAVMHVDWSFLTTPVTYLLYLAVPCFFYISGYLITASAFKNNLRTYFKKRIARIYPAYLCCLIMIVVFFAPLALTISNGGTFNLMTYLNSNPSPIKFFIYNLPLILLEQQIGTTLNIINIVTWNGSSWTLFYEFSCYIAVALGVVLLSKLNINKKHYPLLFLSLHIFLIIGNIIIPENSGIVSAIHTGMYFASMFFGGAFIYIIKDKLYFSYKLLGISIIFCLTLSILLHSELSAEIMAIPLTYIILFIATTLKSPKFIQKNDISYGIYIYAWPVQCIIACIIVKYSIPLNIFLYMIICWLITAFFALVSWFLLEKPILNKVR